MQRVDTTPALSFLTRHMNRKRVDVTTSESGRPSNTFALARGMKAHADRIRTASLVASQSMPMRELMTCMFTGNASMANQLAQSPVLYWDW